MPIDHASRTSRPGLADHAASVRRLAHVAALATALLLASAPLAPAAEAQPRVVRYSVESAGVVSSDLQRFREVAAATLNDPRGWSLGGSIVFREAERAPIRLTLATPAVVGAYSGCSAEYSCRSGPMVLINERRWIGAAPSYPGPTLLHSYRQQVINHEVGHALGFGHAECPGPGRRAPVMQQQSKGLDGCERSAWPSRREREQLARRAEVAIERTPPRIVLGWEVGGIRLGQRRDSVRAAIGTPHSVKRIADTATESYALPRLAVTYTRGRVVAVTTRSPAQRSARGLHVGVSDAFLARQLPGDAACDVTAAGATRHVHVRASGTGPRRTIFTVRDGRVAAVGVATSVAGGGSPPGDTPADAVDSCEPVDTSTSEREAPGAECIAELLKRWPSPAAWQPAACTSLRAAARRAAEPEAT